MANPPPIIHEPEAREEKSRKLLGAIVLLVLIFSFIAVLSQEQSTPKPPPSSTQSTTPSQSTPDLQPPPEPVRQGLYVKTWKWAYTDYGRSYIEGVVINDSNKTYSLVWIEFAIYNERDERIGTAFDTIRNLKPGEKWRFKASPLLSDEKETIYAQFQELSGW